MIELLVAAFIMAIGLMGLMFLQMMAIRYNSNSRSRTTATLVSNTLLQAIQTEGQHNYAAKMTPGVSPTFTPLFTTTPGTAIANTVFGTYNLEGIRLTNPDGTAVANLATLVPDVNKRVPVFTVSWARRAYPGTAPVSGAQSQEFITNIAWTEESQTKYLSISRTIRY